MSPETTEGPDGLPTKPLQQPLPLITAFTEKTEKRLFRGMRIWPPAAGRLDVDFQMARRRKLSENAIL